MESTNLLMICAIAFSAVFILLVLLAIVMRIIIAVFPQKAEVSDMAVIAAVSSMAAQLYPGTKITNIEEIK